MFKDKYIVSCLINIVGIGINLSNILRVKLNVIIISYFLNTFTLKKS